MFEKKEKGDEEYVRPDNPELLVNNIARFNTTSRKFHTLEVRVENPDPNMEDTVHVGVTNGANYALVRTIECVGKGDFKCENMYIGGTFTDVFGEPVAGLAKANWHFNVTHPQERTLEDVKHVSDISAGVVTTITELTPDLLFYGGIFGPEDGQGDGVKAPIVLLHSDTGYHCPLNVKMQHLLQCQGKKPPFLCCDNFYGAVFDSMRLGPNEFLVGGDFSNPIELENFNPVIPIPDGFPDDQPDPVNPFNFSGRKLEDQTDPEIGLGYQHLVVLPIPTYTENGALLMQNITTRWTGGPDGPVIDVSCREWDESIDRCVDVLVSGEFSNWVDFDLDVDLDVTTKIEVRISGTTSLLLHAMTHHQPLPPAPQLYCPERMVSLKWNRDADPPYYEPHNVIDASKLDSDSFEFLDNFHQDFEGKVSTALAYNDTIVAGGSFKWSNNIYVWKDAESSSANASLESLPPASGIPEEGDMFFNCMKQETNSGVGRLQYDGASFCCRSGSYCPQEGVDIACPLKWGYYCRSNRVSICDEGYYCKTPGEMTICPKGHICLYGAIKPTQCAWFEICGKEGLARPEKNSGFIFAALTLGMLGFFIIVASRYDIWSKRRGRKFIESHFSERFNAFMSSGDGRDKTHKATEMIKTSGSFRDSVLGRSESGNSGSDRASMAPQPEMRVDLTFRDLSVTLANGLKILNGVSGEMKAGTMTAIMGPSGCGKSTLMNALTNRIRDGGKVGGKIYINGELKHLTTIAHVVGFVPQEDIMHRDLTIRENLRFYLRLKGDPSLTREQRRR